MITYFIKRLVRNRLFLILFPNIIAVTAAYSQQSKFVGSGNRASEKRELTNFNRIEASASLNVFVTQGPYEVRVEADDNLIPLVVTNVSGRVLELSIRKNTSINNRTGLDVYVSMPELASVVLNGSTGLSTSGNFTLDKLTVKTFGSGNISMAVTAKEIQAETSGSGHLEFKGKANLLKLHTGGSGNIYLNDMVAEEAFVELSGSGTCEAKDIKRLHAALGGSGNVYYSPTLTTKLDIRAGGSGKAIPR